MFTGKDIGVELANLFGPRQESAGAAPPVDDSALSWTRTAGAGGGGPSPYAGMYDAPTVQREAAETGVAQPLAAHELVPSGGRPLDRTVQRTMEAALGGDFGGVRIHTDDHRASAMGAEAYTVGSDIVFKSGNYDPSSAEGQRRIAHELTHVQQQRAGAVAGTDLGNGVGVSDPSDSFERAAEDAADRAMGGGAPAPMVSAGGGTASVQRVVQREESDDKNPILDKVKEKLKDYLGDKGRLGKVAGPVIAAGEGLINVARAEDTNDRVVAAEKGFKSTVGAIGSSFGGKGGKEVAEALAQKGIDWKRKAFPFQGEVDASGEGATGDLTGGNPHTDAPRDAAGNTYPNDTQLVTEDGRIIDRATGKDVSTPTLSTEQLKAMDEQQQSE